MVLKRQLCYPCRALVQPQSIFVEILMFFSCAGTLLMLLLRGGMVGGGEGGRAEENGSSAMVDGESRSTATCASRISGIDV